MCVCVRSCVCACVCLSVSLSERMRLSLSLSLPVPLSLVPTTQKKKKRSQPGLTDHPLTSLLGSHSSLVKPRARRNRLHEGRLDDHWDAGYLVEFRSCSSPLLPLHKCLQITGLTSHASHTDALSDGVVAVPAYLVGIRSGLPLALLHFRSGFGPGCCRVALMIFFLLSSLLFCPTVRLLCSDDQRRWRPSCLPSLTLAESFFLGDMKSRKSANPPEFLSFDLGTPCPACPAQRWPSSQDCDGNTG